MRLVIGGYAQGKLGFVLRSLDGRDYDVWDGELPGEAERELRVRRAGEDTFYYFIYRGKPCAQARIYFDHLDGQWRFELTQVARAHYESVRAYFTGKMRKGH